MIEERKCRECGATQAPDGWIVLSNRDSEGRVLDPVDDVHLWFDSFGCVSEWTSKAAAVDL